MDTLKWLGHASFEIKAGGKIIYLDPYEGEYRDKADLVLMTHSHPDHCDPRKMQRILKEGTLVIAPSECAKAAGVNAKSLKPGETLRFGEVEIKAVEAYNNKRFRSPGIPFHPKGFGVGYLITMRGRTIYHAGDTDYIPEMKRLGKIHLALLPCGGFYTMDVREAKEAVLAIKPEIFIPMHRREAEMEEFRDVEKSGIKLVMLKQGEEFAI